MGLLVGQGVGYLVGRRVVGLLEGQGVVGAYDGDSVMTANESNLGNARHLDTTSSKEALFCINVP